jgi:hypothetical protein
VVEDEREPERFTIPEEGYRRREAATTAGTPQPFAATSTLTVPVTFASFEARGFFTDRGTEGMAAGMPAAPGKKAQLAPLGLGLRSRGTSFLTVLLFQPRSSYPFWEDSVGNKEEKGMLITFILRIRKCFWARFRSLHQGESLLSWRYAFESRRTPRY